MKAILVTQRFVVDDPTGEMRLALDVRWSAFLAACRMLPVLVPADVSPADLRRLHPQVTGILLTGGNGISEVEATPLNTRRDELEMALLAEFPDLPVIGVCRGFQFLATRAGLEMRRIDGHVRTRHRISASEGALARFDGVEVNSYHNWAPETGSASLAATVRSADGGLEGAVFPGEERRVGIMWHPERENPFRVEDISLFVEWFS